MAQQQFTAKVIGIPAIPTIREVNIRSGPGTNQALIFKVPVGTSNLPIIEVQPDIESKAQNGKLFQWFRVQFPQGVGWVRDDLIEVWGNGTASGYTVIAAPVQAFSLQRSQAIAPGQEIASTPVTQPATTTPVATAPTVTPVTTQPTIEPEIQAGPAMAECMMKGGANVRPGPGTGYNPPVARMNFHDKGRILEVKQGDDGKDFKWIKLDYQGKQGWIREDLVRLSGGFGAFKIANEDQFPCPMPDGWWIRDYDADGSRIGVRHDGWDHAGDIGFPIYSGPVAAMVTKVADCAKCGAQGKSAITDAGYALSDGRVLRDAGWNYGYGHYVVVRYLHDTLPPSVQAELANRGFGGQHLFVKYAHLSKYYVQTGQEIGPNTHIADNGNSGNSTGPHLHLEVRAHANPNETAWFNMKAGLMTPGVLFLR